MLIWYNPDTDTYQKGYYKEFTSFTDASINRDRFEVLYEFGKEETLLADKILHSLNRVRKSPTNKIRFSIFS